MRYKFFTLLLSIVIVFSANAQSGGNNCGCNYLNMCNYTATYTYKGQKYYGINGSENNGYYYRCLNGVITLLTISQVEVDDGLDVDYNPFTNTETTTQYIDYENSYNVQTVLKYNLPVGGKWQDAGSKWQWEVIEKKATYTYKGKTYRDVIKVRSTYGEDYTLAEYLKGNAAGLYYTPYYKGRVVEKSSDKYWAKNSGFIHSEDSFDSLSTNSWKKNNVPNLDAQQMEKYILAQWSGVYDEVSEKGTTKFGDKTKMISVDPVIGILFTEGTFINANKGNEYLPPCAGQLTLSGSVHNFKAVIADCYGEGQQALFTYVTRGASFTDKSLITRRKQIILGGKVYESSSKFIHIEGAKFPQDFKQLKYDPQKARRDRQENPYAQYGIDKETGRGLVSLNNKVKEQDKVKSDMEANGIIDSSLVGIWKYKWQSRDMNSVIFYRFNADGTYTYYKHSNVRNRVPDYDETGIWRVVNGNLKLLKPKDEFSMFNELLSADEGSIFSGNKTKPNDTFPLEILLKDAKQFLKIHNNLYQKITEKEYQKAW